MEPILKMAPDPHGFDQLLNEDQVIKILGLSNRKQLRYLCSKGELPYLQLSRQWRRFKVEDVKSFIQRNTRLAQGE